MAKCICILGSGANIGKQCSYNAKPNSDFCGLHQTCKNVQGETAKVHIKPVKPVKLIKPVKSSSLGPELKLGKYKISPLGMGTLPLGVTYAPGGRPEKEDTIALIHHALSRGVRFFDTADTYGAGPKDMHYMEEVLTEAIDKYNGGSLVDEVVVGTKMGMKRINNSTRGWRPRHFKDMHDFTQAVMDSYNALGNKPIKLWSLHHTDGYDVDDPAEFIEVCQTIKQLMDDNIIENVGLCNCSTAHLDIARNIIPISAVQNSFSLYDKAASKKRVRKKAAKSNKNEILQYCHEHNILFMPHGTLGGTQSRAGKKDLSVDFPALKNMADAKGVSPQVLVLAWMRLQYPNIVHIVGTRKIVHLDDILDNVPLLKLTKHELSTIHNM